MNALHLDLKSLNLIMRHKQERVKTLCYGENKAITLDYKQPRLELSKCTTCKKNGNDGLLPCLFKIWCQSMVVTFSPSKLLHIVGVLQLSAENTGLNTWSPGIFPIAANGCGGWPTITNMWYMLQKRLENLYGRRKQHMKRLWKNMKLK